MRRGKSKRGQKNIKQLTTEEVTTQDEQMEQLEMEDGGRVLTSKDITPETGGDILREIVKVSKELGSFKKEIQESFSGLKEEIGKKLTDELTTFKQELNQKLTVCVATLQTRPLLRQRSALRRWRTVAW